MPIVFLAFRIMVGLGLLMLRGRAVAVCWLRWRGAVRRRRWFLRCVRDDRRSGFVAVLAGWITTEVGRQPWTVYGLLRTADSRLAGRCRRAVATSLVAFVVVYCVVFAAGICYIAAADAASGRSRWPDVEERRAQAVPTAPSGRCRVADETHRTGASDGTRHDRLDLP